MSNHENEKKVTVCGGHMAWIYFELWDRLGKEVGLRNRTDWIIKKCEEQFDFLLKTKEDIKMLESIVKKHFYKDRADWLREKIREELKGGKI